MYLRPFYPRIRQSPKNRQNEFMSFLHASFYRLFLDASALPLARDLESCTASLAALAGRVGVEEWTEISLIRMQIRALAGQVEGLLIPSNKEVA